MGELIITILKYVVCLLLPLGLAWLWFYKRKGRSESIENILCAVIFLSASLVFAYSYVFEKLISASGTDLLFGVYYLRDSRFGYLALLLAVGFVLAAIFFAVEFVIFMKNPKKYAPWEMTKKRKVMLVIGWGILVCILLLYILVFVYYSKKGLKSVFPSFNHLLLLIIMLSSTLGWEMDKKKMAIRKEYFHEKFQLIMSVLIVSMYFASPSYNVYYMILNYSAAGISFLICLFYCLKIVESKKEKPAINKKKKQAQ